LPGVGRAWWASSRSDPRCAQFITPVRHLRRWEPSPSSRHESTTCTGTNNPLAGFLKAARSSANVRLAPNHVSALQRGTHYDGYAFELSAALRSAHLFGPSTAALGYCHGSDLSPKPVFRLLCRLHAPTVRR